MTVETRLKRIEALLTVSDLVNEAEAAAILRISVKYLQQQICLKKIPANWYKVNSLGHRFYHRSKLVGL